MPSHSHSFTPSGTVSSHSHSFTPSGSVSSTFTGTAVTSGANNRGHTHNFEHKHTTGNQSANPTFSGSHDHRHQIYNSTDTNYPLTYFWNIYSGVKGARYNAGHFYATDDTGYIYTDIKTITISGTTVGNHTHTTNSLINTSGTAITNTGAESQNHTHSVTASGTVSSSFTGTAGTTAGTAPSFTGTAGNTGANGSGSSFSILPPYVVKYCWERTA